MDITVVFKPEEAIQYSQTIYCEVTGRESRLPLRVKGDGVGPKIMFSFDTLDVENLFVNSQHSYEVRYYCYVGKAVGVKHDGAMLFVY